MAELNEAQQKAQKTREADAKKQVDVTVDIEGHVHQGITVKKGATIKVSPSEKDWMAEHNIIKT